METTPVTENVSPVRSMTSAKKLLQAAALAAMLVPLGTIAVETTPISCGFGDSYGTGTSGCTPLDGGGDQSNRFDWGDYFMDLTLYGVSGPGTISINDDPVGQSEFDFRTGHGSELTVASHLAEYDCIPLVAPTGANAAEPCRQFQIVASPGLVWDRHDFKIAWFYPSHLNGFDGDGGRARVLRDYTNANDGTVEDGFYDQDMCDPGNVDNAENYLDCVYSDDIPGGDPIIFTGDTDFSMVAPAVIAQAPEPAALLLIGTGTAAMLLRRRQRRGSDTDRSH